MAKSTRPPGLSPLEKATSAYLKRLKYRLEKAHFRSISALKAALCRSADSEVAAFVLHATKLAGKTLPR